jgi:hypothetical protein
MYKYKALVIAVFILASVGLLINYLLIVTAHEEPKQAEVQVIEKWRTKYYKCVKSKRILVPVPIYIDCGDSECVEELEEKDAALEGIKKWCDPNCQNDLEECLGHLAETQYQIHIHNLDYWEYY